MMIQSMYQDLEEHPTNQTLIFEISKIYAKHLFRKKQYLAAIGILLHLS